MEAALRRTLPGKGRQPTVQGHLAACPSPWISLSWLKEASPWQPHCRALGRTHELCWGPWDPSSAPVWRQGRKTVPDPQNLKKEISLLNCLGSFAASVT